LWLTWERSAGFAAAEKTALDGFNDAKQARRNACHRIRAGMMLLQGTAVLRMARRNGCCYGEPLIAAESAAAENHPG